MAENIKLEVVTPERNVVETEAQIVMAPGSEGEFGVLSGHTSFLSTLKTGILRYTDASGSDKSIFISGGFAEALPEKITVLAESAESLEDIDVERAKSAMERAEKRLENREDLDVVRAKAALLRAIVRLDATGVVS
ncbi:MAG: F0F1 ATP synthase subunit epsilon [Desulfobacterales bacterium]|nr:F0F1 ATP synthase subunit epsilon [Desulfobacterales bacterium]MCP4162390.1 F0F1 ATP synthase subunit epsilon [Deltaproteobacteria bacterium]